MGSSMATTVTISLSQNCYLYIIAMSSFITGSLKVSKMISSSRLDVRFNNMLTRAFTTLSVAMYIRSLSHFPYRKKSTFYD
jgi:hypothetical protein